MHPESFDIARVSAIVVASIVSVVVVIATAVRAFKSLLLGHLFPII
jgi:hypothetical protein